jgi:hypothetical protein
MIRTASLHEACADLFRIFPLAARDLAVGGATRSMVLMLRDGDDAQFFVLMQGSGEAGPLYSVGAWPAGDLVSIDGRGRTPMPDVLASAITRGVPLPRHGSTFGWPDGAVFGAIIVTYTDAAPGRPLPSWSVMPLAGPPASRWPPFTRRAFFGQWFWDDLQAGRIVPLDQVIAGSPDSVFWVNTQAILASDCCAVARDIPSPQGPTLMHGRYVDSDALLSGAPVPSLTALLADTTKIDMAPRFRRLERSSLVSDRGCHGA